MSLTIGCDPELVCRINGRFSPARDHFKSNSSMGLDGNDSVAEVRPGYSESPLDLTAKIRTILEYGNEKSPDVELISGHYADGYPIGGHIHLSISPCENIIDSLDVVLTSLSNCIDDKSQRQKRERSGYGQRKAFRNKSYGMEYRTPGSWLLSPATSLVTLTLAKLSVIGSSELNLDFSAIKGNHTSKTFLRNFDTYFSEIPEDCQEGIAQLKLLLVKDKITWNQNLLPNWGLANSEFLKEAA